MTTSIYQSLILEKRTNNFLYKAKEVHDRFYDLSRVVYINNKEKVTIGCPNHGYFLQTPNNHLTGYGCQKCKGEKLSKYYISNKDEFTKKANITHNFFYIYDESIYKNSYEKLKIKCPTHGLFLQSPAAHVHGRGCQLCSKQGYSKLAIKWIDTFGLNIQHALNGGEYSIPNTNYRVDGYCKDTNTVYEFHGDNWHGNPNLFESDDRCHPFNNEVTAGELYQKTIEREGEIKSLGYNLVVMWENDYFNKGTISNQV